MGIVQRNLLRAGVITLFAFVFLFFGTKTPVYATVGGYEDDGLKRYRFTITYDVENACDYDENVIRIGTAVKDKEFAWSYPPGFYDTGVWGSRIWTDQSFFSVAREKGVNQTIVYESNFPIVSVEYGIEGDLYHISEWYLRKVEVETLVQTEGVDIPKKHTLWAGKLGMRMAHSMVFKTDGDNGYKSGAAISFWNSNPSLEISDSQYGSNKTQVTYTDQIDTSTCGEPRIAGITDIKTPESISAPTDNNEISVEFEAGELYDLYGAPWPSQRFEIISDKENDKHISVAYENDKWLLVAQPDSNASKDYEVTVSQWIESGHDYPTEGKVTVKTFDYNFTFLDNKGNVIKTQTVDYGGTVTSPDSNYTWTCDEYEDWTNTTNGPQNRTLRPHAFLKGSGTKDDPFLIKSGDDWESFCFRTQTGSAKGEYYRLENDISVTSMVGTKELPFQGIFDGNGKTITIDFANNDNNFSAALFAGTKDATIRNLRVAGSIKGNASHAAVLLGENAGSTLIENCTVSAEIEGGDYIGGFTVGSDGTLKIVNCTFDGKINCKNNSGGFVAWGTSTLVLKDCVFKPQAGSMIEGGATFVNNTYDTLENCKCYTSFAKAQGEYVGNLAKGSGTSKDPYIISSVADWEQLRNMTNAGVVTEVYFKLGNDISVTTTVGTKNSPFKGVFDGGGYTLTVNYNYSSKGNDLRCAPFSYVKDATIRNLTVDGSINCDDGFAAGILGETDGWTLILNCVVSARVTGRELVGGFAVGSDGFLDIENCLFDGFIGANYNNGGFVAQGSYNLILRNCVFDPASDSWCNTGYTFVNPDYSIGPPYPTYYILENCIYYKTFGTAQGTQSTRSYNQSVTAAKNLKVSNLKVKAKGKNRAQISWKKNKNADGYQIRYSTDGKFKKSVKTVKINKTKAKKLLKKIKPGKKWYFQIRTYKKLKDPKTGKTNTVYGKWSKKMKIQIKK